MNALAHRVYAGRLRYIDGLALLEAYRFSAAFRLEGVQLEGYFKAMVLKYANRGTKKLRGVPSLSRPKIEDDSLAYSAWL